jgi:putative adenylate-forming enzyme
MNVPILLALLRRRSQLRATERLSRSELLRRQAHALVDLRQHAYAHSPFYREFHRGLYNAPLHELPVLSKDLMMRRFDDLLTDRRVRRSDLETHLAGVRGDERFQGLRVCSGSGSTGARAVFVFGFDEWVSVLASFERGTRWAGFGPKAGSRRRVAAIGSTSAWHVSPRATRSTESWWVPVLRMDAGEPLDRIVEQLNAWQPELLLMYPSIARLLAAEQRAGRLRASPAVVLTGSEVLSAATRTEIEEVWRATPFDQYAATEVGNIAAECSAHAGLHLFEDHVIAEVVDAQYRPVPVGQSGDRLLVTVLFRRIQPLIRYELTDIVQMAPTPCTCGRPFALIKSVRGRADDLLTFAARAGGEIVIHPVVFENVLDRMPAVGWQLASTREGLTIRLRGLAAGVRDEEIVSSLTQELAARGAIAPPIRIQRVSDTARGATGKAPFLVENVGATHSR